MADWHLQHIDLVLESMKTDKINGLGEVEARVRLNQAGANELTGKEGRNPWRIFFNQFTSTVVLVLLVAGAISAFLLDFKNAITIGAIVLLNSLLGFTQEARAERSLAALKKLAVPTVKIRRDGRVHVISARDIVPGDIILLEAGNAVPADGRIIESINLRTQESALTGESEPVDKRSEAMVGGEIPLAERFNMVYAGTQVTYGRGLMIATETGMATEIGRIAAMIQSVTEEATPLQKRLDQLGSRLALIAIGIVAVIFIWGLFRGEDVTLMFLTAVSIAVAAVPEGLPAIVTINLAFGSQRLLKKNALIRRLPAVETLGSVTDICTDKTGTLTENKMTLVFLDVAHHQLDLRKTPLEIEPKISCDKLERRQALNLLLIGGALCNDSIVEGDSSSVHAIGEPTEAALAMAAARYGFHKSLLEISYPRIGEIPFDSSRKRMSTLHQIKGESHLPAHIKQPYVVFTKGSVDSLLSVSRNVLIDGILRPLEEEWKNRIHVAQNNLAQSGMRVMGVGIRALDEPPKDTSVGLNGLESDITFIGLVGLQDPLRHGVKEAVEMCFSAGIRPIMITGDHPLTAQAIAKDLGFAEGRPVTGMELDRLSQRELDELVESTSVYARVTPEHKLAIVQALQGKGRVVAMTGDGVNDAPALKKAEIGVAMGISGTDVAKESSDMVLLDDNFSTIVAAVKEGRVIYENIRKFLRYLLTGNVGEIWLMVLGPLIGMPIPLLPVQILWMNLITDGIPALALGVEPAGRNVMKRPPIPPGENIFGRGMGSQVLRMGFMVGLVPLLVGAWYWYQNNPIWQTMVFTTLILLHVEMAFAFRSPYDSFFHLPFFSNKPLLGAVLVSILLQMAVVYIPFFQSFFNTVPLPPKDLLVCLFLSTSVFWMVEAEKWVHRRRVVL